MLIFPSNPVTKANQEQMYSNVMILIINDLDIV